MNRTDIELIARNAVADCIKKCNFADLVHYKTNPFELDYEMFDTLIQTATKGLTLPQETRDDILEDIDECDDDDEEFILAYCRLYWEHEIDPDEIAEELLEEYTEMKLYNKWCSTCCRFGMCTLLDRDEDGCPEFVCHQCNYTCVKCQDGETILCKGCAECI